MPTLRQLFPIQIEGIFASPVPEIHTIPHITVERRMRPVGYPFHIPMLYRIEMNVVGMALEIQFVPDLMFPEPTLPDRRFAVFACRRAAVSRIECHSGSEA